MHHNLPTRSTIQPWLTYHVLALCSVCVAEPAWLLMYLQMCCNVNTSQSTALQEHQQVMVVPSRLGFGGVAYINHLHHAINLQRPHRRQSGMLPRANLDVGLDLNDAMSAWFRSEDILHLCTLKTSSDVTA